MSAFALTCRLAPPQRDVIAIVTKDQHATSSTASQYLCEYEEQFPGSASRHRGEGTLPTERRAAVSRHKQSRKRRIERHGELLKRTQMRTRTVENGMFHHVMLMLRDNSGTYFTILRSMMPQVDNRGNEAETMVARRSCPWCGW